MERDEIKRVEQELDAILKLVLPEAPAAKDVSADGRPDEAKKEGSAETDTQEKAFRGLGAVKETAASQEPGDGEDELEAKDGFMRKAAHIAAMMRERMRPGAGLNRNICLKPKRKPGDSGEKLRLEA